MKTEVVYVDSTVMRDTLNSHVLTNTQATHNHQGDGPGTVKNLCTTTRQCSRFIYYLYSLAVEAGFNGDIGRVDGFTMKSRMYIVDRGCNW